MLVDRYRVLGLADYGFRRGTDDLRAVQEALRSADTGSPMDCPVYRDHFEAVFGASGVSEMVGIRKPFANHPRGKVLPDRRDQVGWSPRYFRITKTLAVNQHIFQGGAYRRRFCPEVH